MKRKQTPTQTLTRGDVVMETNFLAMDDQTDVQKLRSGEYTAFYVNELQYLIKELFDEMTSRAMGSWDKNFAALSRAAGG